MTHHRDRNHPDAVEGPQVYDWSHQKTGFTGRLVLPFFSTKYKTDMTQHCLLRALTERVLPEDESQLQTEQSPLLRRNSQGKLPDSRPDDIETLLPDNALWRAPNMKRHWNMQTFFALYYAHFQRAAPLLFANLREHVFHLDEAHYQRQFEQPLRPIDGLGFSGSLFFFTHDRSLIVKSVGRRFEYTFLYSRMMEEYAKYYMLHSNSDTLLSQITDVLYSFDHRIGGYLGVSPDHYMVMTNVLECLDKKRGCRKWDLKPQNFFEPTRDLVPDTIKSEQAKSGLADELDEEMVLTRADKTRLMALVEQDTAFLEKMQTIDYSLLLGRYPIEMFHSAEESEAQGEGRRDPMVLPEEGSADFVRGVRSADGKWVYKMCILDFLWNVEQLRPKVMKTAGKLLPEQTVTTEPERYREEFLKMMDEYIVVWDELA